MGFHLRKRESVQAAVRRIATEEILGAIHDIRTREPNLHEAVHDFRRRCKKMRGLLRLIRPHLADNFQLENGMYRDLSRQLSHVRDVQALIEALDRLTVHFAAELDASQLSHVRHRLVEARDNAGGGEANLINHLEAIVIPLEEALLRVPAWEIPEREFDAFVDGLCKTYGRGRKAMAAAYNEPSTENFHEWRKRVKYHWHHTLLLRKLSPVFLRPHRDLADHLGELLGQDHDYAVLADRLTEMDGDDEYQRQRDRVSEFIERRQRELRTEMHFVGQYLHAEKPRALAERWRAYWRAWRSGS
ncbi:MAG: CHAD domain-containing protein [Planctomycetales bacterium]|nr:CHAD domain-containing protein [Planctomycetales bacterium]MCA9167724.1 CHAD domain-containing protein [Planctomycetales bacterium]